MESVGSFQKLIVKRKRIDICSMIPLTHLTLLHVTCYLQLFKPSVSFVLVSHLDTNSVHLRTQILNHLISLNILSSLSASGREEERAGPPTLWAIYVAPYSWWHDASVCRNWKKSNSIYAMRNAASIGFNRFGVFSCEYFRIPQRRRKSGWE